MRESVDIILRFNDAVVLQRRDHDASISSPGKIGFFGGQVEPGENPTSAARRELTEEIEEPLDITNLKLLWDEQAKIDVENGKKEVVHCHVYELTIDSDVISVAEGEGKITIPIDEIGLYANDLDPFVKKTLDKYIKEY